jgi:hypothetical protein
VAAALVALSPLAPRVAAALPACPFKLLTGLPCPTCGATRAALALARFDLAAAFAVSPLAAGGWTLLVAGGLVAGVASLARVELHEPSLPRPFRWFLLAALLANWAYLIWSGA